MRVFPGNVSRRGCGGRNEIIFRFVLFVVTALGGGIFGGGKQWSQIRVPVTPAPMCVFAVMQCYWWRVVQLNCLLIWNDQLFAPTLKPSYVIVVAVRLLREWINYGEKTWLGLIKFLLCQFLSTRHLVHAHACTLFNHINDENWTDAGIKINTVPKNGASQWCWWWCGVDDEQQVLLGGWRVILCWRHG